MTRWSSRLDHRRLAMQTAMGILAASVTGAAVAHAALPTTSAVASALAKLPLRYEENVGQMGGAARFVARARGHRIFLARGGPDAPIAVLAPNGGGAPIAMRVIGAPAIPEPRPEMRLPGESHYLRGRDPAAWQRGVRGYARVTYAAIHPGIDLVFRGHGAAVEFDFVVAPGADPGAIALAFDGAHSLSVASDGAVVVAGAGGRELRVHAPVVYQEVEGRLSVVDGRFALRDDAAAHRVVAFELGGYDASLPLVIDPVLSWSTYLGGVTESDEILDLDVDADGNVYVTGFTSSSDYPTTGGAFDPTDNGGVDAFVTKLSPDGSALIYSTYFGGNLDDNFSYAGIAVDGSGQAHITGITIGGAAFPTTAGAFQETSNGGSECYVAKLSADGGSLLYSTFLGGNSNDRCQDIAVDSTGRAYVTGVALSGDFPTSVGAFDTTPNGSTDAFVTAFTPGGGLVYSTFVGGSNTDMGFGIALDGQQAIITGQTASLDFPMAGAFQPAKGTHFDAFVTKLDATGTSLVFSTYLGGSDTELGSRVASDETGAAYVTGETESMDFPTSTGAFQETFGGLAFTDAFVVKLSAAGALEFSSYLGGGSRDRGTGIAVRNGSAVVVGETGSSDFPTADPIQATGPGGLSDGFVTIFAPNGASLDFSTYFGGDGASASENFRASSGLEVGDDGSIYVGGVTLSSVFPTTPGVFQETDPAIGGDSYVAKIIFVAQVVPAFGGAGLLAFVLSLSLAAFSYLRAAHRGAST